MVTADQIEEMLREVVSGKDVVYATTSLRRRIPPEQTLVCHFDFEPRIRYARYITKFRSVLNDYTEYEFDVASIRKGCIDVCYVATNYRQDSKNLVRRQIMTLLRDFDLKEEFSIHSFSLFGKYRLSSPAALHNDSTETSRA